MELCTYVPVFVTVLPKKWLRIIASFCVLYSLATVGECVYGLSQEKDFPIILKPFPTYSKAVPLSTTRLFIYGYILISLLSLGADAALLYLVEKEPGKALRVFLYWNLFHLVADLVIIIYFFVANTLKYDAGYAWNSAPMFTFAGFLIRISILANVYQTYTEYKDHI
ncbi:uncharacterized protein LOC144167307 isoform X2 [Haemaphysalis longicornis]